MKTTDSGPRESASPAFEPREWRLADLAWPDVQRYLSDRQTIVIPHGATEQHGRSCPIGTDAFLAKAMADDVGSRCGVLVAPTIPYGDSLALSEFPGTVSLRPSTFGLVIRDIVHSLYLHGFRRFLLLGAHWDNGFPAMSAMSEYAASVTDIPWNARRFWEYSEFGRVLAAMIGESGGHADAADASLLMCLDPSMVNMDELTEELLSFHHNVSPKLVRQELTRSGVIGSNQALASLELGKAIWSAAIDGFCSDIDDLEGGPR